MKAIYWVVGACLLIGGACAPAAAPPSQAPAAPPARGATGGAPDAVAPAASAPTAPAPANPDRISAVYSTTSAVTATVTLGQRQGIFRDNDLLVEVAHAPGNAGPAALVSGQAQVMLGGCAELIAAIAGGADMALLSTTNNRMDYVLTGGPNMPDRASVRGKQLGVSRFGSSSHLTTKFIIKQIGLDAERDVAYVQVGNTPERIAALLTGGIDGAVLTVDEGQLIRDQPGVHVVVDMTQENVPYCGNGVVVMRSALRENPDIYRRFTRALAEIVARFKTNREEGVAAVAEFMNESDLQKAALMWESRSKVMPAKPYPEPLGLQFVIDQLAEVDDRIKGMTVEQVAEPTFMRELDESGYLDRLYTTAGGRS